MARPRIRMLFAVLVVATVVWIARRTPETVPVMALVALTASLASTRLGRDFFRGRAAMAARNYRQTIAALSRLRGVRFVCAGARAQVPVDRASNHRIESTHAVSELHGVPLVFLGAFDVSLKPAYDGQVHVGDA